MVDHDPPLGKRWWDGDPARGEKPGKDMTDAERRASATDRTRMRLQPRDDSNKQGGEMKSWMARKNKENGLE